MSGYDVGKEVLEDSTRFFQEMEENLEEISDTRDDLGQMETASEEDLFEGSFIVEDDLPPPPPLWEN